MASKIVSTFTLSVTTLIASAQLIVPDDLRRCLDEGLRNSYELQIVRGEEQQASNNASLLNSGMLPTIDLDGGYQLSSDMKQIDYHDPAVARNSYNLNTNSLDVGVDLNWTLFDGFEVRTNYKKFKELESQSKVATQIAIEDYIASLTAEYYNYIQQQSRLKILNMAVDLSKERLRIVRARYVVGNFSRLDYQQAQVDFNADSASYIKQREILKSSAIGLNELMARSNIDQEVPIRDTLITIDTTLNYDDILGAMQSNNSYLIQATLNSTIANLDYKAILSRNYPYVTMNVGYGVDNYKYNRTATRRSLSSGMQAGISVGFTIFDTTRKSARRNAAIEVDNAKLNRQDVELKLRSQLSDLWQAYINNLGLLNLERKNIVAATENYEIAMERYMLGNLSGIEMREAQKSLLDAEDRILEATYNIKICEISLLQISGQVTRYL